MDINFFFHRLSFLILSKILLSGDPGTKLTYLNLLLSLFRDSSFKVRISDYIYQPYKGRVFEILFNPLVLYLNLFNNLSRGKQKYTPENLEVIVEQGYLDSIINKTTIVKIIDAVKKDNQRLLTMVEEANFLKLDFGEAIKDLWKEFKNKTQIAMGIVRAAKVKKSSKIKKEKHVRFALSVSGITALVIILILIFLSFQPARIVVEKYDSVRIRYTMWKEDQYYLLINQTLWVNMTMINDTCANGENTGIILGLYNKLLGKEVYYESEKIYVGRCVDNDLDGYDDNSGEPALSFGKMNMQYYDTDLAIEFKILGLEKNNVSALYNSTWCL